MEGIDRGVLKSVADQLMAGRAVELAGETAVVRKTNRHRLKTARFQMNGREYEAIDQNPEKPSRWGKLAREGHRVVQFRDVLSGKYVAAAVDGKVVVYGKTAR
jgi:CHASE2 domain-containing sensor protein